MTPPPRPAPSHVPTLTEVIELPAEMPVLDVSALPPTSTSPPALPQEPPAVVLAPLPPQPAVQALAIPAPVPAPPAALPVVAAEVQPEITPPAPAAVSEPAVNPSLPALPIAPALPPRATLGVDEAAMAQRVLNEVQRQIDGMLEYRLREALTPILARTSEALVRELRQELSKTMRDVVSRAVAQEVARQRTRP